ncbi:MAG: hypothetical protein ACTHN8_07040 [Angustibacter sp.]
MVRFARRAALVLLVLVVLVLTSCGGGGSPGAAPTSSTTASTSTTATVRHGQIQVKHLLQDGQRRLTLQAVLDTGQVVMVAIGSDTDDANDAAVPQWTPMRQALLIQLRTALKTLGWTETGTGPAWYQVAFSGGPDARIPVIESPTGGSSGSTLSSEPAPPPSTTATGGGTEVGDLLALIGKPFDDPAVAALVRRCGAGDDYHRSGNIACIDEGFELTLDSHLVVKAITLFNLEYSGYGQYGGTLPLGLTWDDDYHAVIRKLGPPLERLGGGGVEVQLRYRSRGVYVLVDTTATHDNPDYLANAKIHWIELSVDPAQGLPPD